MPGVFLHAFTHNLFHTSFKAPSYHISASQVARAENQEPMSHKTTSHQGEHLVGA